MNRDSWNPDQYHRFADERRQPFFDLLDLVRLRRGMRVADLGCGTGELTVLLHQRLEARETAGLDSSEAMLAKVPVDRPVEVSFVQQDIAAWRPDPGGLDLLFSNAALQWLDRHSELVPRLIGALAPGGQLAVQIPANHDHLTHRVAAEIASQAPFRQALGGYVRSPSVLAPEEYAALLEQSGCKEQHVRLQVYGHRLASREDVVEWVRGTLLTDYEKRMTPELFERFLAVYRSRLLPMLADTRPHFYPFKRILFWGLVEE